MPGAHWPPAELVNSRLHERPSPPKQGREPLKKTLNRDFLASHACKHAYIHTHTNTYTHMPTNVCIHTYTNTYIHTQIKNV